MCIRDRDNSGHPADKLYTSPEDMLMTYEALAPLGKFMLAATFGNVHGVYKPCLLYTSRKRTNKSPRPKRKSAAPPP